MKGQGHYYAAAALTRMQSEQQTRSEGLDKVRRHVRILVDIARWAGESSDLQHFLDQTVVQVARAVEIDHVKVLAYRRGTADLLVIAGIGWKEGVVGSATLSSDLRSAPGRCFQTGEPVVIDDMHDQQDFVISGILRRHGIVSLANTPVLIGGSAWGVLEVDSTTPRDFSQDTIEFLTAAAALIGVFLQAQAQEPNEAAKLAAAASKAQTQELLLRELQHRVKNSFQLILSSISMQKRRYSGGDAHRALEHVASRINAISLAHDQLAPRQNGQSVLLPAYLRALCLSIKQQVENIEIDVDADEVELTIDRAVPLGLMLNEVAINSIKHAFGPDGGRISVRLAVGIGYGEGRLVVSDNGRGISNPNPNGSGLKLIAALARQIGGTLDQQTSEQGTATSVTFPIIG